MHTWQIRTNGHVRHSGHTQTTRAGWDNALSAVADLIHAGTTDPVTLAVDEETAHLTPSGDTTTTLHTLDELRTSILGTR